MNRKPNRRPQSMEDLALFSTERKTEYGWCWEWRGCRATTGYGKYGRELAHRIAWEVSFNQHPGKAHVLHRCDHPPCINPAHLFLGTQAENMRDMAAKGRATRGEHHPRAKLSKHEVSQIRRRRSAGEKLQTLADAFGVGPSAISRIANGVRWRVVI